jgi:hypothetical protein
MKLPTKQNFVFGTKALKDQWCTEKIIQGRVGKMNKVAGTNYISNLIALGDGYIFSTDKPVFPHSFSFTQLKRKITITNFFKQSAFRS